MLEIPLLHIILLLVCHYVSDFHFQTDTMAINKSTSNKWLTIHVLAYIYPFAVLYAFFMFFGIIDYMEFYVIVVANFVLHWITDYVTSRIASYYYKNEKRSAFFKTIGADQLIHGLCLFTIHASFI